MSWSATTIETPATAEELARVLAAASAEHAAVMPVGGGRAMGMGGPPSRCDVELHTTRLDRVIEHSQADLVVSVEAGVTLEALQDRLAQARQFLPLDPFGSPGHTVGGLLASGWTGPLRLRYGSARDCLIGIRVALADGRLAAAGGRVVKNVSGYDLMKLHHGALGTLGVIVAATFKVSPAPLSDVTLSVGPTDQAEAWVEAERALSMPLPPVALELFHDGRVVARFHGTASAVDHMVTGLGWPKVDSSVWLAHSRRSATCWARISVPRAKTRLAVETLPSGSQWWASPGLGVVHWTDPPSAESLLAARLMAEQAGGGLVLLAAPHNIMTAVGAWGSPPSTLEVMRSLKVAFDPHGILNPGRFVY